MSASRTPHTGDSAATERERTAGTSLSGRGRESAPRPLPSSLSWMSLMNSNFVTAATAAAPFAAPAISQSDAGPALAAAARLLLADLERGQAIDAQALRTAMTAAFNGSDAEGAWTWKTAYDACEAAQILFLRKFGPAMRERGRSLPCWPKLRRSFRPTHAARRRARHSSSSPHRSDS